MKLFQDMLFNWSNAVLSFLALLIFSCSTTATLEEEVATVVNRTSQPIVFKVLELESSHFVDPILSFPLKNNQMTLIQPDESLVISSEEIDGDYRPGKDMRVFLYTVREDSAHLSSLLDLTHEKLEQYGFRVAIQEGTGDDFTLGPAEE